MAALRKYSKDYEGIRESTIRGFKKAYLEEKSRKREAGEDDEMVRDLPPKKRGQPVIIGRKVDDMVQEYVLCVRAKGGVVNTAVVIAGARGLLQSLDRARLAEYGGPATLSRGWAKPLLK